MTNIFLLRLFVFQNVQQKRQKPEQITSKMTDHSDNEHKHIPGHTRDRRGLQSPLCDIFFLGPHDITRYFGNWYDNHTIFTIFYKRKYVQNLHFFLLKARSGDSWQLAKKRVDYKFFGNLYFPVSDHLWGVYFDFLCHFHLKIASPIGTFIHQ